MTEKQYMNAVAELGCLICGRPAQLHHVLFAKRGLSSRAPSMLTIPLCSWHHNGGGWGECIHNGTQAFERNVGMTEPEMLAETIKRIVRDI